MSTGWYSWAMYRVSAFPLLISSCCLGSLSLLFLLWPDFLFLIVWSPSPEIFLICPCCTSQTFWFLIFILCHIPGPCVLNLLFTSLSVKLFPRPCFNVLTLVCLWLQWPRCSPPYLTVTLHTCLFHQSLPLTLNLELGLWESQTIL